MGNSKKQKTRHLTEDEIWDDSALVRSWDEAVAEYEYYHSIHARNEDVEEVLRQAEIAETTKINVSVNGTGTSAVLKTHGVANEEMEDGEVYDEQQTIDHVLEEGHPTISPVGLSPKDAVHPQSSTPQGSKSSISVPAVTKASNSDVGLQVQTRPSKTSSSLIGGLATIVGYMRVGGNLLNRAPLRSDDAKRRLFESAPASRYPTQENVVAPTFSAS